jgi:hypothetical protein
VFVPPVVIKRGWVSSVYLMGAAPGGPMHP